LQGVAARAGKHSKAARQQRRHESLAPLRGAGRKTAAMRRGTGEKRLARAHCDARPDAHHGRLLWGRDSGGRRSDDGTVGDIRGHAHCAATRSGPCSLLPPRVISACRRALTALSANLTCANFNKNVAHGSRQAPSRYLKRSGIGRAAASARLSSQVLRTVAGPGCLSSARVLALDASPPSLPLIRIFCD
jgi:hypothetical protein